MYWFSLRISIVLNKSYRFLYGIFNFSSDLQIASLTDYSFITKSLYKSLVLRLGGVKPDFKVWASIVD